MQNQNMKLFSAFYHVPPWILDMNFVTVMKVTVQRCDYSIGARKSTRKLTKITETSSDDISVILTASATAKNSKRVSCPQS